MKEQKEVLLFAENYVHRLFRNLDLTDYLQNYFNIIFPYEENYPRGGSGIFIDATFELNPDLTDFENSKVLYENLILNETQASDKRLWTYLCHVRFWSYMKKRWPLENIENPISRIKDRYFLNTLNIESLTRNGISRLWWYTHLTIDNKRQDPFELTKVLLFRQDIAVSILERSLGSCRSVRTAILEFLLNNPDIKSNENKTRELIQKLNLAGGVKNLPVLDIQEIKLLLNKIKSTL